MPHRHLEAAHLISETPVLAQQLRRWRFSPSLAFSLAPEAAPIAAAIEGPPRNSQTWHLSAPDSLQASPTFSYPCSREIGVTLAHAQLDRLSQRELLPARNTVRPCPVGCYLWMQNAG